MEKPVRLKPKSIYYFADGICKSLDFNSIDVFSTKSKVEICVNDENDKTVKYLITSKNKCLKNEMTLVCDNLLITFRSIKDVDTLMGIIENSLQDSYKNIFEKRTEKTSEQQYFYFYSLLSQQQNMLQDNNRTYTYYRAIFTNFMDFENKVVLDVGTGSGILAIFAAFCGAKKVYAVEASSIFQYAQKLVESNNLSNIIKVVYGKIEEIEIPEKIDVILSEPLGFMLLNERMLETYIHARKWLKPNGKMFPTTSNLYIAPFTDESLFMETFNRFSFWSQNAFYGVDLSSVFEDAKTEVYRQPVLDTFDIRICTAQPVIYPIDFLTAQEIDLQNITINLSYHIMYTCHIHGLAFWFDVAFNGSSQTIILSTAPTEPLTHWYQVRCLFPKPLLCLQGHTLIGCVRFESNLRQSYDITIELTNEQTGATVFNENIDLKNPHFRSMYGNISYGNNMTANPPPPSNVAACTSTANTNMANENFSNLPSTMVNNTQYQDSHDLTSINLPNHYSHSQNMMNHNVNMGHANNNCEGLVNGPNHQFANSHPLPDIEGGDNTYMNDGIR